MNEEIKAAYEEILGAARKHADKTVFRIEELQAQADCHLFGLRLRDEYLFRVNPEFVNSTNFVRLNEHCSLRQFGDGKAKISWPDDGRQPGDEMLLVISFPTGAYIFGGGLFSQDRDYPAEFFKRFWNELKGFGPKYVDTSNHNLYFGMENAAYTWNRFDGILTKYREMNKLESLQRRKEKLLSEIEKLGAKTDG